MIMYIDCQCLPCFDPDVLIITTTTTTTIGHYRPPVHHRPPRPGSETADAQETEQEISVAGTLLSPQELEVSARRVCPEKLRPGRVSGRGRVDHREVGGPLERSGEVWIPT